MRKHILVTGIGGDIGQSIIKCLKDPDYETYILGCDIDPYAAGRKDVDEFLIAPKAVRHGKYSKFIEEIAEKYKIKYIYPMTEQEIVFFDQNRSYFEKKGITVFINNPFIISTFLDKYKTANFLKNNNLPYPSTFLIGEYDNQLNYPLIVKPRRGCGSKGVIKINNNEEFNFYKKITQDVVVQEYLGDENEEYTTGIFSDGKKIHSITFRRKIGFGGVSKIIDLASDSTINEMAEKIARNCKLVGSMNMQSRRLGKDFIVFEVNPRFSSTVYFRHYFGFQDVKWWLDLKENKKIDYRLKYKKGIGVRTLTEVFFDVG